ncbi:DUF6745 domain-containing protein [Mesorhizobium sp. Z1-4]|uniref:DUF6745 domain-containing protein n=1 Tax=Mesorhizobium sp. Z1-4 TaxID=2448478 RepID=UPI001FE15612|nr:hypothetical protein [Mesorhizobium sp. Z1-4]
MPQIIRRKDFAGGGITPEERLRMDEHAKLWISRAFRTDPIEPDKIIPAIEGLYAVAGLKKPRVVIVPSPLVMAFAFGASTAIWHRKKNGATDGATRGATRAATYGATRAATDGATRGATDDATRGATRAATYGATRGATDDATDGATRAATYDATRGATDDATDGATDGATYDATRGATRGATDDATRGATRDATYGATRGATDGATRGATRDATDGATRGATDGATYDATDGATDGAESGAAQACGDLAGQFGIECARRWWNAYQGGNMWAGYDCYLTACRDILGLELREHEGYRFWEQASIHGGFRVMHEEFCLVSDFPEAIRIDDENRPHCEDGPSHRWRDGWALYHWHGTRIPAEWIEDRDSLTPAMALTWENVDQRAAACEILGWHKIIDMQISAGKGRLIDEDDDPQIGRLVEIDLPDHGPQKFIHAKCGTGRDIAVMADAKARTVMEAQAASYGLSANDFLKPEVRT